MKFTDVLKDIQKRLVVIIQTKDLDRKKKLIVNLSAGISVLQTDYPLTKKDKEILNQILKILAKEYETLDKDDLNLDDLDSMFELDLDDLESQFTFSESTETTKKNVKGAGRKFDTKWVDRFYTIAEILEKNGKTEMNGDLKKFIEGKDDIFYFRYYNKKGVVIVYRAKQSDSEYEKLTLSKYNNTTKTREKKFKTKKEFLAALKRLRA